MRFKLLTAFFQFRSRKEGTDLGHHSPDHLPKPLWQASSALLLASMQIVTFQPLYAEAQNALAGSGIIPSWWGSRGVIAEDKEEVNVALANVGQLSWVATQAHTELSTILPPESGFESRFDLTALFTEAKLPYEAGYEEWKKKQYSAVNIGQLKAVALNFYKELNLISPDWVKQNLETNGLILGDTFYLSADSDIYTEGYYPWNPSTPLEINKGVANLGQLKNIFALRFNDDAVLESTADGLPDLYELALLKYHPHFQAGGVYAGVNNISQISWNAGDANITVSDIDGNIISGISVSQITAPFAGLASSRASVSSLLSQHEAIGSVGGSFSTGGDGSANYSIPIDIPKGTSGMEPSIAIGYSSAGGNGALGVGFDLSGFQRITRGSTSRAKEGSIGIDPVDFDGNDRFFFDGELLIAVENSAGNVATASDYGKHGTIYRTESDSFARITSWGVRGSGPAFWTAETKAGLRIEMGNCSTSCIYQPGGRGALVWNVNKVADNVGNYYRVCYDQESPAGAIGYRPNKIFYTGNDTVNPALAPYNQVKFVWEDRDDVSTGVINGVKVCNDKRLKRIEISGMGASLHSYEMTYDYSASTRRSRLQQVQKHYPNAESLPATTFNWESHLDTVVPAETSDDFSANNGRQKWYEGGADTFNYPSYTSSDGDIEYTKLLDMNGDGLLDRVSYMDPAKEQLNQSVKYRSFDDYGVWVALNTGSGFAQSTKWFSSAVSTEYGNEIRRYIASVINRPTYRSYSGFYDVNGDGLPDRVQFYDFSNPNADENLDDYFAKSYSNYHESSYNIDSNTFRYDYWYDGAWDGGDDRSASYESHLNIAVIADCDPFQLGLCVALNTGEGFTEMKKWRDVFNKNLILRDTSEDKFKVESSKLNYGQSLLQWTHSNQDLSAFIDMNADGIPDRVDHKNYETNERGLWVSLGLGYYDEALQAGYLPAKRWYHSSSKDEENYITWTGDSGKKTYSTLMDMNGDGILDKIDHRNFISGHAENGYGLFVSLGRGYYDDTSQSGFHPRERWDEIAKNEQNFPQWDKYSRFLDVNGDGLPDRVHHYDYVSQQRGIWVQLNKGKLENGSGFEPMQKWLATSYDDHSHFVTTNSNDIWGKYIDMNKDGLVDRVQWNSDANASGAGLYVAINKGFYENGAGFHDFEKWYENSNYTSHNYITDVHENGTFVDLLDVNADGLPDRLVDSNPLDKNDKGIFVAINNGGGFDPATRWYDSENQVKQNYPYWANSGKTYSTFLDINGDGFPDRLDHYNYDSDAGAHPYFTENGTSISDSNRKGLWVSLNTGNGFIGGGVNDDEVTPPTLATSEMIHSITDGLNAEIRVEYKRMNDPTPDAYGRSIYVKENPTAAEFTAEQQARIIRAPGNTWAVARYAEQDGQGGFRWTSNYYGGRKFDQKNEVDLGFRWVETFDESRNTGSISITSQIFPFHGNPIENIAYLKIGTEHVILSRDISSYAVKYFPYDGTENRYIGGKIRFLYNEISSSETYSFDTSADSPSRTAISTLANTVLPGRSFTGRFLHSTSVDKTPDNTTQASYSATGDLLYSESSASAGGYTTVINNTYAPSTVTAPEGFDHTDTSVTYPIDSSKLFGKWIHGRLSEATTTTSRASTDIGSDSITKKSVFTYYTAADGAPHLVGMLKTEIAEPDHALALVKETKYDAFGNTVEAHTYPVGNPSLNRWIKTVYDSSGRFPIQTENQLGHTSSSTYDPQRALLLSSTDANGLTVSYFYDAYGTKILTRNPNGTESAEITAHVSSSTLQGVSGLVHKRMTQSSGSPAATVYLDAQGRALITESISFDGRPVYSRTNYDALGRKTQTSAPFFSGETPLWTTVTYDAAHRPWCTEAPDGSQTKVYHDGYRSILYNAKDNSIATAQKQIRIEDHNGRLIETIDNIGGSVKFYHSVDGKLLKTTAPGGHIVETAYDIFGYKTWMNDTDTGAETITYTAFGDPHISTDAAGNTTTISYDTAGRAYSSSTHRNTPSGLVHESTTTTTYDTAAGAGLGKVHTTTIQWHEDGSSQTTTATYDQYGRSIRTDEIRTLYDDIQGQLVTENLTVSSTYDDLGRTRTSTNAGGLTLLNLYNDNGFASGIQDYSDGSLYWEPLTHDASGRLLTERLGNGVVNTKVYNQHNGTLTDLSSAKGSTTLQDLSFQWDTIGNLLQRDDNLKNLTETFTYDDLNRLKVSTVGSTSHTVNYDAGGNITSRSDRGTYSYHTERVHQLTGLTSGSNNREYAYDALGNLIVETHDGVIARNISWGAHGKITQMNQHKANTVDTTAHQALYGAASTQISFDYGAGINRIRKVMKRTAAASLTNVVTTSYLGSYERIEHQASDLTAANTMSLTKIEHRHNIGGFLVKTLTEYAANLGQYAEKKVYQLHDHLGSISALTDASGDILITNAIKQEFSYDAWGQRRDAQTWLAYSDSGGKQRTSTDTNRGYTSHEMLDEVGLVHMNGRIYDSEVGRFLSADPHIQAPENSQNYNRYAYVLNNPLSYTDPSGYFFKKLFKAIGKFFKKVANVFKKVAKWVKENWRTVVMIAFAFVAAFVFVTIPALSGVSLFGVSNAAGATALGLGTGIGGTAVAGAIAGSLSGAFNAALNGGDFGDILKGAVIGALQGAATAYVGGTLAKGFETGSFGSLLDPKAAKLIAAHGVIGGTVNVAMGGKFGEGFLSAAVSKIAAISGITDSIGGIAEGFDESGASAVIARTLAAGVIGGTVSAISGGKFANGAYTAAFQHLLNAELSAKMEKLAKAYSDRNSDEFAVDKSVHGYGKGTYKCSCFVRRIGREANADPLLKDPRTGRWTNARAGDWANPSLDIPAFKKGDQSKIIGYYKTTTTPSPGDVVAYALSGGGAAYNGHVGIYSGSRGGQAWAHQASSRTDTVINAEFGAGKTIVYKAFVRN